MKLYQLTILLLLTISFVSAFEDYYKILGVNKKADEKEIKKAFRRLSAKYHPDRDPSDEAKEIYQKVNLAHECLSDKNKRYIYDTKGIEGVKEYEKTQGMAERGYESNMRTGPNYQVELEVTLEELYKGTTKEYRLQRNVICDSCRGTGAKDGNMSQCSRCGGRGSVIENVRVGMGFTMRMENQCNRCGGLGKIVTERCPRCGGKKVFGEYKNFEVEVEKGMSNRQKITFEGESEQHPDYLPGDIIFVIKEKDHEKFKRDGNDLHTTMTLTLKEALLGFKKSLTHLDGHIVVVNVTEPTQPFSVKKIDGEGMPLHNMAYERGHLYIKF